MSSSAAILAAVVAASAVAGDASRSAPPIARERLPAELAHLTDEEVARIARMSPLPAVPADPTNRFAESVPAAEFGHALFFDARLSPKGVSCATCHEPARFFTDGKPLSIGVGTARRNAPTVVDAARRRWNGWDGKFDSLWSQALSPIENPLEMGGDRVSMLRLVRDDPSLRAAFERAFGAFPAGLARGGRDPLDAATARDDAERRLVDSTTVLVLKALGAYQRRLVSGSAPIDAFIKALESDGAGGSGAVDSAVTSGGNPKASIDASIDANADANIDALDPAARRGLAIFVSRGGCYQCHRGPSFTDEEFHALGLAGANGRVPDDPARLAAIDFLQANPFNAAGEFSDARGVAGGGGKAAMVRGLRRSGELFGQFRTPALRGVALTPPYMHDGRFATLEDVVRFYDTLEGASPVGHHGEMVLEPLGLGESGRADLVAFLRALTPKLDDLGKWTNPSVPPARTAPVPTGR